MLKSILHSPFASLAKRAKFARMMVVWRLHVLAPSICVVVLLSITCLWPLHLVCLLPRGGIPWGHLLQALGYRAQIWRRPKWGARLHTFQLPTHAVRAALSQNEVDRQDLFLIQQFSRATRIIIASLAKSRWVAAEPRRAPQNPRRDPSAEASKNPFERQMSSESFEHGCAPQIVTLWNFRIRVRHFLMKRPNRGKRIPKSGRKRRWVKWPSPFCLLACCSKSQGNIADQAVSVLMQGTSHRPQNPPNLCFELFWSYFNMLEILGAVAGSLRQNVSIPSIKTKQENMWLSGGCCLQASPKTPASRPLCSSRAWSAGSGPVAFSKTEWGSTSIALSFASSAVLDGVEGHAGSRGGLLC